MTIDRIIDIDKRVGHMALSVLYKHLDEYVNVHIDNKPYIGNLHYLEQWNILRETYHKEEPNRLKQISEVPKVQGYRSAEVMETNKNV